MAIICTRRMARRGQGKARLPFAKANARRPLSTEKLFAAKPRPIRKARVSRL